MKQGFDWRKEMKSEVNSEHKNYKSVIFGNKTAQVDYDEYRKANLRKSLLSR